MKHGRVFEILRRKKNARFCVPKCSFYIPKSVNCDIMKEMIGEKRKKLAAGEFAQTVAGFLGKGGVSVEVTLEEMLAAREARVFRQLELNRQWKLPLVSFSMNIPGPVKDSPLIRRGFEEGCTKLARNFPPEGIKCMQVIQQKTGSEALYVIDMDPVAVKRITTAIEDENRLGRLFDMDVLDSDLNKLDREVVNGKSRDCIVCGAPGRGCASRRTHSVDILQSVTNKILMDYFMEEDARRISELAVCALLDEAATTPKPGLVDQRNSGSHTDMDMDTLRKSANILKPYFHTCVRIGQKTKHFRAEETFFRLRKAGLLAEQDMYRATCGVNTHKGAVFTIGVLCGAVGRLWSEECKWNESELFLEVSAMTEGPMTQDFLDGNRNTAGMRLYSAYGIRGIRGEVSAGLPAVKECGLPIYRRCLAKGMGANRAGAVTLLNLIVSVTDTNMIKRGGVDGAAEAVHKTANLLLQNEYPENSDMELLDDWFIERNLSPGGCADLLAAVYFMHSLSLLYGK